MTARARKRIATSASLFLDTLSAIRCQFTHGLDKRGAVRWRGRQAHEDVERLFDKSYTGTAAGGGQFLVCLFGNGMVSEAEHGPPLKWRMRACLRHNSTTALDGAGKLCSSGHVMAD